MPPLKIAILCLDVAQSNCKLWIWQFDTEDRRRFEMFQKNTHMVNRILSLVKPKLITHMLKMMFQTDKSPLVLNQSDLPI